MNSLQELMYALLVWLSFNTATDVPHEAMFLEKNIPDVYLIPFEDLNESICGCDCGVRAAYFDNVMIIVLGVDKDGYFEFNNKNKSIFVHELEHHLQYLSSKRFKIINKEDRYKLEKSAYEVQNKFLKQYGMSIDPEEGAKKSTSAGGNNVVESVCLDGTEPTERHKRSNIGDIIMYYYPKGNL